MIVDGDHDMAVVERPVTAVASHNQQGSGLLASNVAAGSFAGGERRHQPLGEGRTRDFEGPHHLIDDIITCQAVPECEAAMTRSTT